MDEYRTMFWQRIAILCRYGHISLVDAMGMPRSDTADFSEALGKLISEENRTEH